MSDIVEFLNARLDEDEAVARSATHLGVPEWHVGEESEGLAEVAYRTLESTYDHPITSSWELPACKVADATHIARHDPARELREVAAKRALIEEARMNGCSWCDDGDDMGILRPLASAYSDHPDYQESWAQ